MKPQEIIKNEITKWFVEFRPDVELDGEFVDAVYRKITDENEAEILQRQPSELAALVYVELPKDYYHAVITYVDRVFYRDFESYYEKLKQLGILQNELVAITKFFESKDVTIEKIISEPLSEMEKMEAENENIQYYTESQLEKIIHKEISERYEI